MTPKERVRANIYKQLLTEEKRKNKKLSIVSVSVFILGIFASSGYNTFLVKSGNTEGASNYVLVDTKVNEFEKDSFLLDAIYNTGVAHEKTVQLNPDDFFGLDTQI